MNETRLDRAREFVLDVCNLKTADGRAAAIRDLADMLSAERSDALREAKIELQKLYSEGDFVLGSALVRLGRLSSS